MKRRVKDDLSRWLKAPDRRPLVLRGAGQVGKTWLARELAHSSGLDLAEVNFERDPRRVEAFDSNDPAVILGELGLHFGRQLAPRSTLLFLDEIQAAGDVLGKLRWFFEGMPELAVVAAGSLLEFTLADHSFSMPVGRVTFRCIEPLSFAEYLDAHAQTMLLERLANWRAGEELSVAAHEKGLEWFDRYAMVGGMPAVVAADLQDVPASEIRGLQGDLLATYRADFAKYAGRMDREVLDRVLSAVAGSIGDKFIYSRADVGLKGPQVKRALELLAASQLVTLISHTAANGVPLGAEVKDSSRKAALLDVGLLHALLGTPGATTFPKWNALVPELKARLSEQLVVQQLRLLGSAHQRAELFTWRREGGRAGKVDHVLQAHGRVIPLELKAGTAGSMKSLHQFMHDKGLDFAIRVDRNPPSLSTVRQDDARGSGVVPAPRLARTYGGEPGGDLGEFVRLTGRASQRRTRGSSRSALPSALAASRTASGSDSAARSSRASSRWRFRPNRFRSRASSWCWRPTKSRTVLLPRPRLRKHASGKLNLTQAAIEI